MYLLPHSFPGLESLTVMRGRRGRIFSLPVLTSLLPRPSLTRLCSPFCLFLAAGWTLLSSSASTPPSSALRSPLTATLREFSPCASFGSRSSWVFLFTPCFSASSVPLCSPTWNFKSMLNATINDQAYVNVINKAALGADELIGTALLSVASLIDGQVADIWLTLRKGSEVTGEIHVRAQLMRSGERPIGKAAELAAAGKSALAAGFGAPVPAPAPAPMAAPPPQYAQPAPSPYQQAPPPGYAAYPQQAPPPAAYPPAYPGAPSYAPAPAPAYGAPMPGYGMAPPPMMPVPMPVPVPVASMMPVPQYGVAPPPMGYREFSPSPHSPSPCCGLLLCRHVVVFTRCFSNCCSPCHARLRRLPWLLLSETPTCA